MLGKAQSDFVGENLKPLAIEDHDMVVNRYLAEKADHGPQPVNGIVPEWRRRSQNHMPTGPQRPRKALAEVLQIENMLNHGAHYNRVKGGIVAERFVVHIDYLELALRMGAAGLLNVAFGQVDADITIDAIRRMTAQLAVLAADIQDISPDMGQDSGATGSGEVSRQESHVPSLSE